MIRMISCLCLAVCVAASPAWAQSGRRFDRLPRDRSEDRTNSFRSSPQVLAAFKEVVAPAARATVRVLSGQKDAALGAVVEADGYILTKASEIAGDLSVKFGDGKSFPAQVVGVDARTDLALLKINARALPVIQWADAGAEVGSLLASVSPGEEPVAVGVVSVAARAVRPRDLPGSTPAPNSGFLGVALDEAEGGARILQVTPDSAAEKAGLKVDDVVILIQDTPIIDSETMINTIQHHKPGEEVTIHFKRAGKDLSLKAILGKRPPSDPRLERRDFQNRMGSELSNKRGGFPEVLQHDTVLKPADCGGPVVGLDGRAVGINIARAGRVESYAIPAALVRKLLPELKAGRTAPPATTLPATAPSKK